jgi:hypothetical protein
MAMAFMASWRSSALPRIQHLTDAIASQQIASPSGVRASLRQEHRRDGVACVGGAARGAMIGGCSGHRVTGSPTG